MSLTYRRIEALPRFQLAGSNDKTAYRSFLNVPVIAGCLGAWAIVFLVGAGVFSLF